MEANPGAVERGRFGEYRAAGLTRVSLGAQTFDAARLEALGRIHSPEETQRRRPSCTRRAWIISTSISCTPCQVRTRGRGARPGGGIGARAGPPFALPAHHRGGDGVRRATTCFAGGRLGRRHAYRVRLDSGPRVSSTTRFPRTPASGRQCRHNLNYWTFGDYLGVGAGAHGKLTFPASGSIVRTLQFREPRRYLALRSRRW